MSSKSYVTIEQHQCPICGETFDTGRLLLDVHVRARFERHTVTGLEVCDDCRKPGYIALFEARGSKDDPRPTGRVLRMKEEAFLRLFGQDDPPAAGFAFIADKVFNQLKEAASHED